MQLCFRKTGKEQVIYTGQFYDVPAGATHVGWYNGQLAFFVQFNPLGLEIIQQYCGRRWRFKLIPAGATVVSFPYFMKENSGYHYGPPKFVNRDNRQL